MFYIYLLSLIFVCNGQNDFFIAVKGTLSTCVTNTSFGLSWITEDMSTNLNYVSEFIPPQRKNNFDCDIGHGFICTSHFRKKPWILGKSLRDNTNNEVIFDRRWEDLEVHMTKSSPDFKGFLEYTILSSNLQFNFDIPLSIRTRYEAHIFLCDGPFPPTSNCYWFILDGFHLNEAKSAVRKCERGSIPDKAGIFPTGPCSILLTENLVPSLNENYWSHFKLTKSRYLLTLRRQNPNEIILQLNDSSFDVSHMIIHSKFTNGFWKIHELEYVYTHEETSEIQMGSNLVVQKNFLCVSMFVLMCDSCRLVLTLKSKNVTVRERTFNSKFTWTEIRFVVDDIQFDELQLYVSTIGKKQDRFWAIDKVRLCQKTEFRRIRLAHEATCQLISKKNQLAYQNGSFSKNVSTFHENCSENTIGPFCVPCHLLYENCDGVRICTPQSRCWCSAGFRNFPNCDRTCRFGHYGYNCAKRCQNCYDPEGRNISGQYHVQCDVTNGSCTSCIQNYIGPKCDRQPVDVPENLRIKWNFQNDMILEWKQRNVRESKIEKFFISVSSLNRTNSGSFDDTLTIKEDEYDTIYSYKVNASFLSPIVNYAVRITADNVYDSRSVIQTDLSPPERPILQLTPKLFCAEVTITLEIAPRPDRTDNISIFISDSSGNIYSHPELKIDELKILSKSRRVHNFQNVNQNFSILIGNGSIGTRNPPLAPGTSYNITVLLSHTFKNKTSYNIYFLSCSTSPSMIYLFSLFVLLLIPIAMVPIILYCKRRHSRKFFMDDSHRLREDEDTSDIQMNNLVNLPVLNDQVRLDTKVQNKISKNQNISSYVEPTFPSKPIPIKDFHKYVKQSEKNGDLNRQFAEVKSTIRVYDEVEDNSFWEYIDIVYGDGSTIPRAYIASEVPLQSKVERFWRSVCEANVKYMILLSGENTQNWKYWPDINETFQYNNIEVQLASKMTLPGYVLRIFILTYNEETRYVHQIDFTCGSEQKYVLLLQKMAEYKFDSKSPILIHSSSIRNVGFVLLCHMSLRMAAEENVIDVLRNFKRLTGYTANLVDDIKFYILAHTVISMFIFNADLQGNLADIYQTMKQQQNNKK